MPFQPVAVDEVRQLLSSMPSKSSPLDVLPCTLLKSCADVFASVIATLANLSLQSGEFHSCYKKESSDVTAGEETRTRKFVVGELQANLESDNSLQGSQVACVNSSASTSSGLCQFQIVPVSLQEGIFYRDCTARGSRQHVHGSQRQAGYRPDRP